MKNVLWVLLASGFTLTAALQGYAQPGDQPASYVAAQRSAQQTLWQRLEWETNQLGQAVARTNEFVELATGLNFFDSAIQQWQPSREEWEVYPDAIVARAGRHKVLLPHNLVNGVDVLTADGVRLVATPVSLGFYDPVDGKQMVIAEVKDCAAERGAAVNEIVYRNCFDRIQGSIRYLYTLAGVHQHVVLEQRLQLPAGFSDRTRLEVYTEFAPDTPAPGIQTRVLRREKDPVLRATMVEPDFTDSEISFGSEMKMRAGKAFRLGTEAEEGSIRVGKQFQVVEGRPVLIEAVEFRQLEPLLARLAAVASPKSGLYAAHSAREIKRAQAPVRGSLDRYREASKEQPIELASHPLTGPAVVVDWELMSDSTLTLKGGTCYFVTNVVNLTFPVLEGGVVIKLATNGLAQINLYGGVDCRTGPYRPAIFTVQSDNTVGEVLPGSTGVPATVNHGVTLDLSGEAAATVMENVRFSYLGKAFSLFSGNNGLTTTLRHAQFVQCPVALHVDTDSGGGVSLALQNVLAQSCGRFLEGFVGEYETHEVENVVTAEHLTVHECGHLTYQNSGVSTVALTNSLLVGVTNWGNWTSITTNTTAYWAGDPGGVFQTVGAASHYLADDTYRNAGTTNITADLLAALKSKTTYPPILISTNITADTVLAARPIRVTNAPALGCLYDPLDYVVNGRTVSATLTLTNGVALGTCGAYRSYGICLIQNGELISEGSPVALNRIVRYNAVQEQANTNWQSSSVGDSVTMTVEAPVRFRFTAWAMPGGNGRHFTGYGNMSFRDCQFAGGTFYAAGATCAITNCLWERVQFAVYDGSPFHFYNNLVRGGTWTSSLSAYSGIVRDNVFDACTPYDDDYPLINDHNGYVNSYPLPNSGGSDKTLTSANYQIGPLGKYYYPTNDGQLSLLINAGSRNALTAGLYQFTTTTNQAVELDSTVDIGFHYGYPLDVSKDLLLIYNTNSLDSSNVWHYYVQNRPLIGNANVLGVGCTTNETFLPDEYTNVFAVQVQSWLAANPTKRPQYVILFPDIPSRVNTNNTPEIYAGTFAGIFDPSPPHPQRPSVQYQLHAWCETGWQPFVTSINMGDTNDCMAYIDKLKNLGDNGQVILSASAGGYGNTNYVVDNVRHFYYADYGNKVSAATNGLASAGISPSSIYYLEDIEECTQWVTNYDNGQTNRFCVAMESKPHITNAVNVAGYISWGAHSSLYPFYALPWGAFPVKWTGNSSWYIIETIESHNGQRFSDQGNLLYWFRADAFGGTNHSNTPIGAVTHVDEPGLGGVNNSATYFSLWAQGKNFAAAAWESRQTHYFQSIGDPFVMK